MTPQLPSHTLYQGAPDAGRSHVSRLVSNKILTDGIPPVTPVLPKSLYIYSRLILGSSDPSLGPGGPGKVRITRIATGNATAERFALGPEPPYRNIRTTILGQHVPI